MMNSLTRQLTCLLFGALLVSRSALSQSSGSGIANAVASVTGGGGSGTSNSDSPLASLADEAAGGVLNFVNPCAIAAAVFGMPAAPYVIPCTILRRIRLFRENFMPGTTGTIPSRGLTDIIRNHKLLIGNFILSNRR